MYKIDLSSSHRSGNQTPNYQTMSTHVKAYECQPRPSWTCREDPNGFYLDYDQCQRRCEPSKKRAVGIIRQASLMLKIIQEKFENDSSLNSFDIHVNVLEDRNRPMTWNVERGGDNALQFTRGGCTWSLELPKNRLVYSYIDSLFYGEEHSDDTFKVDHYMDFIKLVTAAASLTQVGDNLKKEPYVVVRLYDASTTRDGIAFWPWLMLRRGVSYYEARHFFPHGIADDPFRRLQVDKLRNTKLQDIGLTNEILMGPETDSYSCSVLTENGTSKTFIHNQSTKLYEIAIYVLSKKHCVSSRITNAVKQYVNTMLEKDDSLEFRQRLTGPMCVHVVGELKACWIPEQQINSTASR